MDVETTFENFEEKKELRRLDVSGHTQVVSSNITPPLNGASIGPELSLTALSYVIYLEERMEIELNSNNKKEHLTRL